MKSRLTLTFMVAAIGLALWFGLRRESVAASGGWGIGLPIGKPCTVQFRRGDALGGGGSLPVNPMTGSVNGAEVAVSGTLRAMNDQWLLLELNNGRGRAWIPQAAVLLVHVSE